MILEITFVNLTVAAGSAYLAGRREARRPLGKSCAAVASKLQNGGTTGRLHVVWAFAEAGSFGLA